MQGSVQTMERFSSRTMRAVALVTPPARDALDLLEQFGHTITVGRDAEVHAQGDQAESCYRVVSGCVRLVTLMEDGRRQVSEFLFPGDLFGFDALDTHECSAEAVNTAVLRRYPRRMVEALAESQLALSRRLRDLTALSLRTAQSRLLLLGRKTASERIASFLLEMAARLPQRAGTLLDLPMSRSDIADHLGLTIETVCRILAHLRREGVIAAGRTGIEIRDRKSLELMASEPRH